MYWVWLVTRDGGSEGMANSRKPGIRKTLGGNGTPGKISPRRPSPLKGGFIRVSVATAIPGLLREYGLDPGKVLIEAGIEPRLIEDPDNVIPFATMGRLINFCATKTRCRHFGLLVGQRGGVSSLGTVGLLIRQARDVGSALDDLVRYLHLHDRGAVPRFVVRGSMATLAYTISEPRLEGADHIADAAMAVTMNIMRSLCGPDWVPSEVRLPHRKPAYAAPLQRFFHAPIKFDEKEAALVFRAKVLQQPLAGADADLHRHLLNYVQQLDAASDADVVDQMRRILRTLVLNHQSSAEQLAQLFSVHRRTLNRRLRQQGTAFHLLLEETRFELASQMMSETSIPLAQIAALLNYSEASAFTRAFRRWSGMTPTEWRRRHGR